MEGNKKYEFGEDMLRDCRIIDCIRFSLTDVSEKRLSDFGATLKECLEFLSAVRNIMNKENGFNSEEKR